MVRTQFIELTKPPLAMLRKQGSSTVAIYINVISATDQSGVSLLGRNNKLVSKTGLCNTSR